MCHAALARPASERSAFLAGACGSDDLLRAEVESLLAGSDSAASFLETPLVNDTAPTSLTGRRLGAYAIEAPLGAGGMGEVYRARDTRLGRDVAVKILPSSLAADPGRRIRFEREAKAVAALKHPNICTIHDVGHDQHVDFLVMELVEGESLAARLARGPLPLDQALARAIEIADALDRAHHHGIVHRDLKPANVMLTRTGSGSAHGTQAKLLDFGLARILPTAPAVAGARIEKTPPTTAGAVLGTVQYMAPEQIEGQPADARTDIFAFGALLYEMVTGRRAFHGPTTAAVMAAILREEPPIVHPTALSRIVRRCLAKDPLRRYQSARDLLNDLEELRESREYVGRRVAGRTIAWIALAGVALVALAAYMQSRPVPDDSPPSVERYDLQPPSGVEPEPPGPHTILAISPDGRWVAFRGVGDDPKLNGIYLRTIADVDAKLAAPAGVAPFFSPDSRWLGFFAQKGMFKLPVNGGRAERICELPNVLSVRGASWGDNGTIVFSLDRGLWRVAADGGQPSPLTRPPGRSRHAWPHVLPGAAAALFNITEGYNDRWRQLAVVSLKTGEVRPLPSVPGTTPRYLPGGQLLYSRFGALYVAPFDVSHLEVTGEAAKVFEGIFPFMLNGNAGFDVSASGSLVYMPGLPHLVPESELVWIDRKGAITPLIERRPHIGVALDRNAQRIVAAIADDLGEADLWIYEIDRGARSQLTKGMHVWSEVAWSPDAQWIFFTSFRSGEAELFRIRANGQDLEQLTFDDNAWEYPGSVSRDGKTLVYWQTSVSQADVMAVALEPLGAPRFLTNSPEAFDWSPRISPDGRWVAYASNQTGTEQVHVRALAGGSEVYVVSTNGGVNPWWSHDGRHLFYQRGSGIWVAAVSSGQRFTHSAPRALFEGASLARPVGPGESFTRSAGPLLFVGGTDRFLAMRRTPPDRRLVYVRNWIEELR